MTSQPGLVRLAIAFAAIFAGAGCASTAPDIRGLDPDSAFQEGLKLYEAESYEDALEVFEAVTEEFPRSTRARDARFYSAVCEYELGDYSDAFALMKKFVDDFPFNPRLPEVEETCFHMALDYIEGRKAGFLGIFSGVSRGIDILQFILTTFPRGKRGLDSQRVLANYYFEDEDWQAALLEYQELASNYPRSEWKPVADFRIGLCQWNLSRGWEYDRELLIKAYQAFEGYVHDYPEGINLDEARTLSRRIYETLAEKDYERASFYRRRERWLAVEHFLERVVVGYPDTEWAERAKAEIPGVEVRIKQWEGTIRGRSATSSTTAGGSP